MRHAARQAPVRQARFAFRVFAAVVVLAFAQLAWWVVFLARVAPDRRSLVMIVSEGAVFLVAMLLGVYLIYGTLSEQVRLKQLRATFFAAVTHELRSPLAAIRLLLETLAAGRVKEPAKVQDLAAKMLLDAGRLERLVEGLLRAGQLENDALTPERRPLDLAALARDAVEAARPRLFGPDDALACEGPERLVIDGDAGLLRGVLDNLIDNAAKYSAPPRRVRVRVAAEGALAVLEVEDDGQGLDAETRALLFRPFFRAGREDTRRAPGTGLGLYLVEGVVAAHGGSCEALSDGPGQGTTLRVRLPLGRGAAPGAAPGAEARDGGR